MNPKLSQLAAPFAALKPREWVLKHNRKFVIGLLLLQIAVVGAVWQIKRQTQRQLEAAAADLARQSVVPFETRLLPAINGEGITLQQNSHSVRSLTRFNDSYFAATEGGLVELTSDGKPKHRFTVLDGLPESDLTALAGFGSQLFIGTRSQGLVMFDGSRFTAYRWTDRKAQAVTSLLENQGRLLIGTFAGGLLEFDGKRFRELKAEDKRLTGIERLVADDSRLFVCTFADGLWVSEGARWRHFTAADGLPSNRVLGVVSDGQKLFAATDFGIAAVSIQSLFGSEQNSFQMLATLPSLSSIVRHGSSILVSKDNGEVFQLAADARTNRTQLTPIYGRIPESLSSCQLNAFSGEQTLWLLSKEGIRRTGWQDERLSGAVVGQLKWVNFGEFSEPGQPTSNVVSALAFDGVGNLWAGSFRNGIDVFTREGRRLTHLETDTVREINSLAWDEASQQMLAGTSQGFVRFNGSMRPQIIGVADGLISNSVSQATPFQKTSSASSANRAEFVLATSRGLAFGQGSQWHAMTAVQGLPSNSVYAVLSHRESIYAGTLSGLAQINSGHLVRVFKDSNSKLTHNWVTAIASVNGRLFVGTYGGGVFELTPSGELASFASEIGKQVVNPNAMVSDGKRLYVGTLDGAWVLEFGSQKWMKLKAELPSATVLSVTSDDETVYFGTTSGIARINKKRLEFVRE